MLAPLTITACVCALVAAPGAVASARKVPSRGRGVHHCTPTSRRGERSGQLRRARAPEPSLRARRQRPDRALRCHRRPPRRRPPATSGAAGSTGPAPSPVPLASASAGESLATAPWAPVTFSEAPSSSGTPPSEEHAAPGEGPSEGLPLPGEGPGSEEGSGGTAEGPADLGESPSGAEPISWTGWHVLEHPIDPSEQADLPFGTRSDWLQPWRAYLETPPAAALTNAVGINFNVPPEDAGPAAKLLAESGFTRARVEVGWSAMSYAHPDQLQNPAALEALLGALKSAGIRPLILLNANDTDPGPSESFNVELTHAATAGARSVEVDPASAARLVPGLSGFNMPGGPAAAFIVTSVSPSGQVQLSQPLPVAVPAGVYPVTTLRYAPFAPPFTTEGEPNPAFEGTLAGWLAYVRAVTGEARSVLGGEDFDVEVWNELSFGSDFLKVANYYNPVPASLQGVGSVEEQLLARTVRSLREPANGLPNIGIGDGFSNQTPFAAGSTSPPGLTALDKHPYTGGIKHLPEDVPPSGIRDVNALGVPEGTKNLAGNWSRPFVPTYTAFFPEYYLTAIQTEFMERDLSPFTEVFNGAAHGRFTAPPGDATPPQVWITETNINASEAGGLTAADERHLQAKAALRTLSAFVNKGVSALYFYAAMGGEFGMVEGSAPGGGETMTAIRRFTHAFGEGGPIAEPRSLSLLSVAEQGDWTQFSGDGTQAHPPLYDREVVGFFPFQASPHRFVVPVYVMTRDLATLYQPLAPASDLARYDLPPQEYRLTIAGLEDEHLRASATDPLTGTSVPVQILSRSAEGVVVEVPLTDSPRLLVLEDGSPGAPGE